MSGPTYATLVVVLGHQNDGGGNLSATAVNRCLAAVKLLKENLTYDFACTGAYGKNFNDSPMPHALLLARFIHAAGVDEPRLVGLTNSANTVEDAVAIRRAFGKTYRRMVIVTSPFHIARVQYVFGRAFIDASIEYVIAERADSDDDLTIEARKFERERHFMPALERINFEHLSSDTIANLTAELRHYDSLSYYPILALGGLLWVYQRSPGQGLVQELLGAIIVFSLTVLLWLLYWRFADTARRFRISIGIASFYLGQPTLPVVKPGWMSARSSVTVIAGLMFMAALISRLFSYGAATKLFGVVVS